MQPTPAAEPRTRADWARAAEGIQLAGLAVFLLLNTTGALPWSFWLDAAALWPVLLMSAGIRIAFEKSRAPWLLLMGPALILGSLAWVASGARTDVALGPWTTETKPRLAEASRIRFKAHLAGSRLQLSSTEIGPGLLAESRTIATPQNARLDSRLDGDEALLELKGGWHRNSALPPWRKQRWDIRVPQGLPVLLEVDGVAARVEADVSGSRLERARIEGVFIGSGLTLPATLRPVKVELKGAFNALRVSVPDGTPVRVHGTGLPFNAIDRGVEGAPGVAGYEVKVDGIFCAVTVESRRGEAAPVPQPSDTPPAEAPPSAPPERPRAEAEPSPAA